MGTNESISGLPESVWIALAPRQQIRLLAIESPQLFGQDALGLGLVRFQPQLPRVVLSDFACCLKSR